MIRKVTAVTNDESQFEYVAKGNNLTSDDEYIYIYVMFALLMNLMLHHNAKDSPLQSAQNGFIFSRMVIDVAKIPISPTPCFLVYVPAILSASPKNLVTTHIIISQSQPQLAVRINMDEQL